MEYPIVKVDLLSGSCSCDVSGDQVKLRGSYIGWGHPSMRQQVAAVLPLNLSWDEYQAQCRKKYKGNVIRDAEKSARLGCIAGEFQWVDHLSEVVNINLSMGVRSGGPMRPAYRRTLEEMENDYRSPWRVTCPFHWTRSWGVFLSGRLLAYINLKRIGSIAFYSQILGHGKYLKCGIMYFLHFEIYKWIISMEPDVEYLIYAGFFQGNSGLQLWKKKTLFIPAYLVE